MKPVTERGQLCPREPSNRNSRTWLSALLNTTLLLAANVFAAQNSSPVAAALPGNKMLADYFRNETALLAERCLVDIRTLEDWKKNQPEFRRQLQEMLGLWPMPERTDLKPVITGKLEHEEFTVEKLHFQASPQLYVTANLYLPKGLTNPVPAILYVCGHSRQFTNGVSFGNKAGYQHHGAWFARNGYVCLIIDTLQLGEIEGLHHGTHRLGHWWWNARGYTPAGVEAWFGIRALDYLSSRPEVDKERIGMTGRSGGGSYSWTVAALDDRVKVVAPVAGITDLQNHVVDGCVEGHCDCMYFVNTYRWDYPMVAALIAPRPLLIVNTDKDTIFPLDGVIRTHTKTRRIYELYDKLTNLGLVISDGPHADTQDLQVPVFRWFNRWFNRWLKGESPLIEMAAKKFFQPEQLRVFDKLPADEVNTKIQESFVPRAPLDMADPQIRRKATDALRQKVFAGWPETAEKVSVTPAFATERDGLRLRAWKFTSQHDWELRFYVLDKPNTPDTAPIILDVVDEAGWREWLAAVQTVFKADLTTELTSLRTNLAADDARFAQWRSDIDSGQALACFAPRGIGLSAWSGDAKAQTHIRRRFMLLGQTLDGMRVWDIHRAVRCVQTLTASENRQLTLRGRGEMGVHALYAALFDPGVAGLNLMELPKSHRNGPDYLNVLQLLDLPEALQALKP